MNPILVTGGARNLGAAICRVLASVGHDVVIHYRTSEKEAQSVAHECRKFAKAEVIYGDFGSLDSLQKFIDLYQSRFPYTKGIVNNVGNYIIGPTSETKQAEWIDLFQTNFFASVFITQALIPTLKAQKGSVINIGVTGMNGRFSNNAIAYRTTKAALRYYTTAMAKELAKDFIRFNMVSPGYLEHAIDLVDSDKLPFKRPGTSQEVAELVAYLFDPKSSYITGQNIEVSGAIGL